MADRRQFLGYAGLALLAAAFGPSRWTWASENQPELFNAFNARSPESVYTALGLQKPVESSLIHIDVPDVAENGANVPVEVSLNLPNVERALLIAEKNLFPLLADVRFGPKSEAWFEAKIKLAETSQISVIAESQGQLFTASRAVKVIVGGCLNG
jgi:sulfur-oxidizing protein SoxY